MAKTTVKWKEYEHVAWSAGYCRHCQNLEAIRVQDVIEVTAFYFIPVRRRNLGRNGVCDFCERPLDRAISDQLINRWDWVPTDGMPKLLESLGVLGKITLPEPAPDARLRALLSASEEASSLKNVNVLLGLGIGLVAGVALGIPVGILLFDQGIRLGAPDRFGAAAVAVFIGMAVGAILGATIYGWRIRTRTAARKVFRAHNNYSLDVARLSNLSRDYDKRVQLAVDALASKPRGLGGAD